MKKLMTVIAAVAMSFGLFAESASHFISFETADKCVQDGKLVKTGWTGDASVIDLVGGYNYNGADARRDAAGEPGFAGGTDNDKCLKLETGSNQVVCAPGGDTDDIYFDQTVKFTGYEEAPTVTDGKIAVWMSAIETEGTEGEDGYVAGETNLYVTCAKVNAAGVATPTNICIGAYDIDAWHRVTIKSLGDIADSVPRAGFLVYIDGAQVGSFEGIAAIGGLQEKFQSYSTSGLLFPALDADDATVTAVAYQGIGELDDVAIDELGPQFARFVECSVVAVSHAGLVLTDDQGNVITPDKDGKFQAAPGATLTFAYEAEDGYFFKGGVLTLNFSGKAERDADPFDFTNDLDAKVAVATYQDDQGGELYAASIQEALKEDYEGGDVTLLIDTEVSAAIIVPADFSGTLNLGTKKVTGTTDDAWLFRITDNANGIEITGGTIEGVCDAFRIENSEVAFSGVTINTKYRAVQATDGSSVTIDENCVFTTYDNDNTIFVTGSEMDVAGTIRNTYDQWPASDADRYAYAICGNGNDTDGVALTIEDGAVVTSANMTAIYFPCAGELTIGEATITGTEGIYVKAGATTVIDGATINGTLTSDKVEAYAAQGDGFKNTGDAFVVDNCDYPAGTPTVTITGGTFTSAAGVAVASYAKDGFDRVTGFITGGLFKGAALPATDLIAADEGDRGKWVEDEEATGFFKPATEEITYVAQIGNDKYETLADALEAAESGNVIGLLDDVTIDANTTVATDITLALGVNNLVIADGKTLTISDNVTVTRTTGGVQNLGSISVAAEKTLDMATFGWGAGLIPATDDQTDGKFAIAGTVNFAAGTDPVAMANVNPGFFDGTVNGAKFIAGEVEYTYTDGEWKLPQTDITVTVKKTDAIESVTYDSKALEFNDNVATLTLPADKTEVTLTLAAVDTIKIPVFTFAKGANVAGWSATGKETSYDVAADDTLNFAAEEANVVDPAITDEAAADAVADAAKTDDAKAKVTELTTGAGAVGGKELANWINTKAGGNVDTALAGNFVKASIALNVAPITEATPVNVEKAEAATGNLEFAIKINGQDVTVEQVESFVQVCDDLGADNDWQKLPDATELKLAVKIEEGKLVITPVAGIDKLFLKVVIPQDK